MRAGLHMFLHRELELIFLSQTLNFFFLFSFIFLLHQLNLLSIASEVLFIARTYILHPIFGESRICLIVCLYQRQAKALAHKLKQ